MNFKKKSCVLTAVLIYIECLSTILYNIQYTYLIFRFKLILLVGDSGRCVGGRCCSVVVVAVVAVAGVAGVRCDLVIVEGVVHADPGGGGGDQRQAGVHSHRGQTGLRPGQRGAVLGVRG